MRVFKVCTSIQWYLQLKNSVYYVRHLQVPVESHACVPCSGARWLSVCCVGSCRITQMTFPSQVLASLGHYITPLIANLFFVVVIIAFVPMQERTPNCCTYCYVLVRVCMYMYMQDHPALAEDFGCSSGDFYKVKVETTVLKFSAPHAAPTRLPPPSPSDKKKHTFGGGLRNKGSRP